MNDVTLKDLKMPKDEAAVQAVKNIQGERHPEHKVAEFMEALNFVSFSKDYLF